MTNQALLRFHQTMTRDEALRALEELNTRSHQRISDNMPSKGKRHLGYIIDEHMQAIRMHLTAIYGSDLEVGPEFVALEEHAGHPKYAFWLEGIQRHLQICESSLTDQPFG